MIRKLTFFGAIIAFIWTLFILFSWFSITRVFSSGKLEAARIEARTAFRNDVTYRRWNASHGGVWAPVTPDTPPNPYLKTTERDIRTPGGTLLTKINPAYMTRQVHEIDQALHRYQRHITSLLPIRPGNRPDAWEIRALKQFETGETEVSEKVMMNNEAALRLMRPLITEEGCLKCHAEQGYRVGDIRGGISVTVPLAPFTAIEQDNIRSVTLAYAGVWIAGMIAAAFGTVIIARQIRHRRSVEEQLIQHEKMKGVVEMAGAVCHELNQPLQMVLGNTEILLLDHEDDADLCKRITDIQKQVDRMSEMTKKLIKITSYETKVFPQGKIIDLDKASDS